VQADASLRVTGRVEHVERLLGENHLVPVANHDIDLWRRGSLDPNPAGLNVKLRPQLHVVLIHVDRCAGQLLEFGSPSNVVNMGVCNNNALDLQFVAIQNRFYFANFVARINNQCLMRLLVAENGAIALKLPYGKDFVDHWGYNIKFLLPDRLGFRLTEEALRPPGRTDNNMDILSRWLHLAAAAVAVGGLVYARFVFSPALEVLGEDERASVLAKLSARLRPLAMIVIIVLVVSGSYNLLRVLEGGVEATYHMAFGVKFLLATHVFAMLYLVALPPSGDAARDAKRPRLMLSAAISGFIIFALGAYLRTLHG